MADDVGTIYHCYDYYYYRIDIIRRRFGKDERASAHNGTSLLFCVFYVHSEQCTGTHTRVHTPGNAHNVMLLNWLQCEMTGKNVNDDVAVVVVVDGTSSIDGSISLSL